MPALVATVSRRCNDGIVRTPAACKPPDGIVGAAARQTIGGAGGLDMDQVKATYRDAEVATKKKLRDADGHDLSDDVANAGDEIRKDLGNAGDHARSTLREAGDRIREGTRHSGTTDNQPQPPR
jgi:hypothetical protein